MPRAGILRSLRLHRFFLTVLRHVRFRLFKACSASLLFVLPCFFAVAFSTSLSLFLFQHLFCLFQLLHNLFDRWSIFLILTSKNSLQQTHVGRQTASSKLAFAKTIPKTKRHVIVDCHAGCHGCFWNMQEVS